MGGEAAGGGVGDQVGAVRQVARQEEDQEELDQLDGLEVEEVELHAFRAAAEDEERGDQHERGDYPDVEVALYAGAGQRGEPRAERHDDERKKQAVQVV